MWLRLADLQNVQRIHCSIRNKTCVCVCVLMQEQMKKNPPVSNVPESGLMTLRRKFSAGTLIHTHVHKHIHYTYIHTYIHIYTHTYIHTNTHTYTYTHIHTYTHACIHMLSCDGYGSDSYL